MRTLQFLSFSFIVLLFIACGKPLPALNDIDLTTWRADANACSGERAQMLAAMQAQKDSLLRLDENEIVKLLGRPDENELYTRNQKFYRYYLTPAPTCKNPAIKSVRLVIRFTAMGIAKEITIE